MSRIDLSRSIDAPIDRVFRTVADVTQLSKALPHIVNIEFLTETTAGVGTRFRETRLMNGRKAATVLEVAELVENDRVRFVADNYGSIWDSLFTVCPEGNGTLLTMTMEAKSYKLLSRIMNALTKGMITKAVGRDLDAVKAYCEGKG